MNRSEIIAVGEILLARAKKVAPTDVGFNEANRDQINLELALSMIESRTDIASVAELCDLSEEIKSHNRVTERIIKNQTDLHKRSRQIRISYQQIRTYNGLDKISEDIEHRRFEKLFPEKAYLVAGLKIENAGLRAQLETLRSELTNLAAA
jgi:hypothetical protein